MLVAGASKLYISLTAPACIQLQPEGADQKHRHLPARHRRVRAVVVATAPLGDPPHRHLLDEGIKGMRGRHIREPLPGGQRCDWSEWFFSGKFKAAMAVFRSPKLRAQ